MISGRRAKERRKTERRGGPVILQRRRKTGRGRARSRCVEPHGEVEMLKGGGPTSLERRREAGRGRVVRHAPRACRGHAPRDEDGGTLSDPDLRVRAWLETLHTLAVARQGWRSGAGVSAHEGTQLIADWAWRRFRSIIVRCVELHGGVEMLVRS
jgi:hypothetical protein